MGAVRNGARTFLYILHKACKLSRLPGFNAGVTKILGEGTGGTLLALWVPLCAFVDTLVAADEYFNQIDYVPEHEGDEDAPGV